ncbi:hypothetical protein ANTQUA_LOCUS4172 [Anthophora quadrimaculata]
MVQTKLILYAESVKKDRKMRRLRRENVLYVARRPRHRVQKGTSDNRLAYQAINHTLRRLNFLPSAASGRKLSDLMKKGGKRFDVGQWSVPIKFELAAYRIPAQPFDS